MMLSRANPAGARTSNLTWEEDTATVSTVQPGDEQAAEIARSQKRAVAGIFSSARLRWSVQMMWYHCLRFDGSE